MAFSRLIIKGGNIETVTMCRKRVKSQCTNHLKSDFPYIRQEGFLYLWESIDGNQYLMKTEINWQATRVWFLHSKIYGSVGLNGLSFAWN